MQNNMEDMKNIIKGSSIDEFVEKYQLKSLHFDLVERLLLIIIAALGLIAAFAWDETFKQIFIKYFGDIDTISDKALYASILSVGVALLTVRLNKIFKKRPKR